MNVSIGLVYGFNSWVVENDFMKPQFSVNRQQEYQDDVLEPM